MEREVKIRKKRFAAFWMALALVCCLAAPIAVNAAGYTIQVAGDVASGLPQTLYAGDTMTYGTADGTTGAYGVIIRIMTAFTILTRQTMAQRIRYWPLRIPT